MGNAFINAFAALEPSSGKDGFSHRNPPRKPAAFFESRMSMNRLFRAQAANTAGTGALSGLDTQEKAVEIVLEQFLNQPRMA